MPRRTILLSVLLVFVSSIATAQRDRPRGRISEGMRDLAREARASGLFGEMDVVRFVYDHPNPEGELQTVMNTLRTSCQAQRAAYSRHLHEIHLFGPDARIVGDEASLDIGTHVDPRLGFAASRMWWDSSNAPGSAVPAFAVFRARAGDALPREGTNLLGEAHAVTQIDDAAAELRRDVEANLPYGSDREPRYREPNRSQILRNLEDLATLRASLARCYQEQVVEVAEAYASPADRMAHVERARLAAISACTAIPDGLYERFGAGASRESTRRRAGFRAVVRFQSALSSRRSGGHGGVAFVFPAPHLSRERIDRAVARLRRDLLAAGYAENELELGELNESLATRCDSRLFVSDEEARPRGSVGEADESSRGTRRHHGSGHSDARHGARHAR